jgi:hypothetical protein
LHTADHIVIFGMFSLTVTGVRRSMNLIGKYLPYNSESVVLHYGSSTNAPEETLLHSTFETNNCNLRRRLRFLLDRTNLVSIASVRLTNSMSTGTLRTQSQGMIILIGVSEHDLREIMSPTHKVVMPMANQKSC